MNAQIWTCIAQFLEKNPYNLYTIKTKDLELQTQNSKYY